VIDYVSEADRPRDLPTRYLTPHPATWRNYSCCPWAKSVRAIDPETDALILCPVTCKRWGCSYCAPRKIRKLAFLTNGAAPNRWIRLGVDPKLYASPKEAWEKTAPKFSECFRQLRAIKTMEIEYLRVTELHQSGYPHYHALLRCGFLPKKLLDDTWAKLTSAPYNWIAKIDSTFSSFRYLVKYLTKLHKIEWTDRHVSYSRNFFREEDKEKLAFPERTILDRSDEHPWQYLQNRYADCEVGLDENGCYHLPHEFCGVPGAATRRDCGLPNLPEKTTEPTVHATQQSLLDTTEPQPAKSPDYYEEGF
jgi:hypothetical protein